MKALIRKYPINAVAEENNEVWFYPWRNADEQGRPYTLEGYKYALCENIPDVCNKEDDPRMNINNYIVEEHIETTGEGDEQMTRKYWTATYTGGSA